jgi:hypothetical protein
VLQALPDHLPAARLEQLDRHLGLSGRRSLELRCAWLVAALRAVVPGAPEQAHRALRETGRMKFLRPLFGALAQRAETQALAALVFAEERARYHPIANGVIEPLVSPSPRPPQGPL